MPALADIVVKKNDGTTNITWSGVVPSSGDNSPAVWRSQTVGTAPAHQPQLTIRSRYNGPRTARRVEGEVVYPTLVTGSDGKISVSDRAIISFSAVVPQGMATADINEAIAQGTNLVASSLLVSTLKAGFAPT